MIFEFLCRYIVQASNQNANEQPHVVSPLNRPSLNQDASPSPSGGAIRKGNTL